MQHPRPKTFVAAGFAAVSLAIALARSDEPVASDDFSAAALSESWTAAKGAWTIEDGKLKGAELASDQHAAVLSYAAPHTDSKVGIAFQLAGSEGFHLSYNHAKGHLFRVVVSGGEVSVRTDRNKKDPASRPEPIGKAAVAIAPGEPHTLTCETKGEQVVVTLDGKEIVSGSHPSLSAAKTGYRLVVQGGGVLFDDFAVWHSK